MNRVVLMILMLLSVGVSACDSGNPVAPAVPAPVQGGSLTVTLTANPAQVAAGSGVPSTLTVTALNPADQQPPADGTLVTLSTDQGNFGPDPQGNPRGMITAGLIAGSAQVSLFPSDEPAVATVLAQVAGNVANAEVVFSEAGPGPGVFVLRVDPGRGSPEGGDSVTVVGGGFVAPLRVQFGGGLAQVVSASSGRITVVTPASQTPVGPGQSQAVDVIVTNSLDQPESPMAVLPSGFVYSDSRASFFVSSVQPNSGAPEGGQTVTVRGGGFREPLRVDFGSRPGVDPMVNGSGDAITVVVPPSAQPVPAGESLVVDVTVTNSLNDPMPPVATLGGAYAYVSGPAQQVPVVASVAPESGPNAGGTRVTILGANFDSNPSVFFGPQAATNVTAESATRLTATTPAAGSSSDQAVDVTVRNSNGFEGTLPMGFTYETLATPIVITAMDPSRGTFLGGTSVTVSGQGFPTGGTVTVELAGVRQTGEVVDGESSLRFTTAGVAIGTCPPGGELPQQGLVVTDVATGNMGSSGLTFTYTVPMPAISRVSPTFGPQLGNSTVNIEGAGFEEPVRVVFSRDGQDLGAAVLSQTPSLIRVNTPRLPDELLPEVACDFSGDPGLRYVDATVSVQVINQTTGCADTFGNAYTYSPTDPSCRPAPP